MEERNLATTESPRSTKKAQAASEKARIKAERVAAAKAERDRLKAAQLNAKARAKEAAAAEKEKRKAIKRRIRLEKKAAKAERALRRNYVIAAFTCGGLILAGIFCAFFALAGDRTLVSADIAVYLCLLLIITLISISGMARWVVGTLIVLAYAIYAYRLAFNQLTAMEHLLLYGIYAACLLYPMVLYFKTENPLRKPGNA